MQTEKLREMTQALAADVVAAKKLPLLSRASAAEKLAEKSVLILAGIVNTLTEQEQMLANLSEQLQVAQ